MSRRGAGQLGYAALAGSASRLLTRERIRAYPAITFFVLALFALYDRLAGHGLLNAIDGAFGGDFLSFYTGGSFVLRGKSLALSDPDAQLAFQQVVLKANVAGTSVWVSPPYFAWLFAPLSTLPYVVAYLVFVAASIALTSASFAALRRALGIDQSVGRMWWMAVQYYPTVQWFLNGQTTALWLSIFIAIFLFLRSGRDTLAGLMLGLFACKPTLALGLFVGLLAARRWRVLAAAAVSSGSLVCLGFLTLPAAMRVYLHRGPALLSLVRDEGYHTVGLHGSFEFATLLLDGASRRLAFGFGVLCTLALLGLISSFWAQKPWRPASADWDLRMAATLSLGVIASPHLYGYDLMLLVLPLFVTLALLSETSTPTVEPVRIASSPELPLGATGLLESAAAVWALGLLGPVLSLAQQHVTRLVFGFSITIQLGVLAILTWSIRINRAATQFAEGTTGHSKLK